MRLPAWSLPRVGRQFGRGPQILVVALAGVATALGVSVGSSEEDAVDPPRRSLTADAAAARQIVAAGAVPSGTVGGGRRWSLRAAAAYYRRIARERVPPKGAAGFLPLYREAERRYSVNWRLIASIHRQETAFSASPSTYHGLNDFGCCAGPMQFNVTNGPVSTWKRYRNAFRGGRRPASYPHRTRTHPSIYDDFDAIMAAGSLLREAGAGITLGYGAWSAAFSYYGHDLFGITYADQVLARALSWERKGFCPNCALDERLVASFDRRYGEAARRKLLASEHKHKKHKKHKRKKHKRKRHARRDRRSDHDPASRSKRRSRLPSREKAPAKPSPQPSPGTGTTPAPSAPPPGPAQPSAPPNTAAPPPTGCDIVRKLLGC